MATFPPTAFEHLDDTLFVKAWWIMHVHFCMLESVEIFWGRALRGFPYKIQHGKDKALGQEMVIKFYQQKRCVDEGELPLLAS
eukprot:1137323-Pelagomonas_calceolata.AAC.2